MHIELDTASNERARLFSFVNREGEVELNVQTIAGARFQWCGKMTGAEALQLAQQIEEAAYVALNGKCPTCGQGPQTLSGPSLNTMPSSELPGSSAGRGAGRMGAQQGRAMTPAPAFAILGGATRSRSETHDERNPDPRNPQG